ncbi:MAG: FRG domain-containing protein, partial [Erysipelothrix sp.]|nr:FRG domain-containing protein [Erysipelothrix sp.]
MYKKIEEVQLNSMEDFEEAILNNNYDYFRGQSNSKWFLNSTILRGQKEDIDQMRLKELVSGYKERYDKVISNSKKHTFSRFLFYIQHSISFSPFIDLTKNPWIAISFILQNFQEQNDKNIETPAALYAIKLHDNKEDNPIILSTHTKIEEVLDRLNMSVSKLNNIESFIIEPSDLSILNDRMQYQQGAFLLLENDSLNQQSKYNQTSMTI